MKNNVLNRLGYDCDWRVVVRDIDDNCIKGELYLIPHCLSEMDQFIKVYWNLNDLICRRIIDDEIMTYASFNLNLRKLNTREEQVDNEYMIGVENKSSPKKIHKNLESARIEIVRLAYQPQNIGKKIRLFKVEEVYESQICMDRLK